MLRSTLEDISNAVGGKILQNTHAVIDAVSTDSRTATPGQLFIPLVGERFDGHDYINGALQNGAEACLTARTPEVLIPGKGYVLVGDTQDALKALATWHRKQFKIPFIQITGSTGKTTTKEMITAVLSRRFRTHKTRANLNNNIGTPLTLLEMDAGHQAAVIETGMDHFGEIRYTGEMVLPDFAVITNIGEVHMENLDNTREGVLRAKSEIFENLSGDGIAVLNGDDDLLRGITMNKEIIFCGRGENCQVRVTDVEDFGIEGLKCSVITPMDRYEIRVTAPGSYMIYPISMAVAIAERLGLNKDEILSGVEDFQGVGSRMHLIHMPENRLIIDDCYNANPQSMEAGLQLLSRTNGRKVAVLGDMGELGAASRSAHARMGELSQELGIDVLIAIGVKAKDMTIYRDGETFWFSSVDEARETLCKQFTPGTAVLVKASHAMAFEKITELLENCR